MQHKSHIFVLIFTTCISVLFIYQTAEARLGGGRSFGGRPIMSRPFTQPLPSTSIINKQQAARNLQQSTLPPFSGIGGLFGGLLAGSLIGSLLFGHNTSHGNFLDIILILGLIYLVFKLFSKKRTQTLNTASTYTNSTIGTSSSTTFPSTTGWETLQNDSTEKQKIIPTDFDFDEEKFLSGAKTTYIRLNESWDERNLDDIAQFTTPGFMKEINQQYIEDPTPGNTEILLINASIAEVNNIQENNQSEKMVSVYFKVLLRENENQKTPIEINEVWTFVKPIKGEYTWKLDGIQQVEQH